MEQFKGTKGKWKIDLSYNSIERVQIIDSNNNGFIDVWKLGKITKEEMKANALLISKAPEMLEMLDSIIQCSSSICNDSGEGMIIDFETFDEIQQLIKEATGL